MACSINIKAKNGNPSILFENIFNDSNSTEEAIKRYLKFKDTPTSNIDSNGEPLFEVIKNMEDSTRTILDLENSLNLRNSDGSRKRYLDWNKAMSKAQQASNDLSSMPFKTEIIKVLGEKGDSRVYYAVSIVPDSESYSTLSDEDNQILASSTDLNVVSKFRKREQDLIKDRLKELKGKKKSSAWHKGLTDQQIFDELVNIAEKIRRLERRQFVLDQYKNTDMKSDVVKYFNDMYLSDLKYVEKLLVSDDVNDLFLAKTIISFYQRLSNFETDLSNHPLFPEEILRNEEAIPTEVKELFKKFSSNMENYLKKFDDAIINKTVELAQNHVSFFQKLGMPAGELNYDFLVKSLQDVSSFDKLFYDPSTNTFSEGQSELVALLVRIMKEQTELSVNKSRQQINKLKDLTDKVTKRLREINGTSNKNLYDIFKQKITGTNTWTGSVVTMFSEKYHSDLIAFNKNIDTRIKFAWDHYFNLTTGLTPASPAEIDTALKMLAELEQEKKEWFENNHFIFNLSALEVFHEEFGEVIPELTPDAEYEQNLKDNLGESLYLELVEEQKNRLRDYVRDREIQYNALSTSGKEEIVWKRELAYWDALHNPSNVAKLLVGDEVIVRSPGMPDQTLYEAYIEQRYLDLVDDIDSELESKNLEIAKKDLRAKIERATYGYGVNFDKGAIMAAPKLRNNRNELTNYYDENYAKIRQDAVLSEFYDFMIDTMKELREGMPEAVSQTFSMTSIPLIRKTFIQSMLQDGNSFLDMIKHGGSELYDMFINSVTENTTISGKDILSFDATNMPEMNYDYLNNLKNLVRPVAERMTLEFKTNNNRKPNEVEKKQINIQATDEVLGDYSFDIGQVLAFHINMTNLNNIRATVLPHLNTLKYVLEHHQKTPDGKVRANEVKRVEHTLNVYTGKPTHQKEGVTEKVLLTTEEKEELRKLKNIASSLGLDVAALYPGTKAIKDMEAAIDSEIEKIDEQINSLNNLLNQVQTTEVSTEIMDQIDSLNMQRELEVRKISVIRLINKLGKNVTGSATADSLLSYMRFLGLGWNLGSVIPNMAAGYYANFALAAAQHKLQDGTNLLSMGGMTRAYKIVSNSILKNLTFSKVILDPARKVKNIMESADYLSDSSNEFNKASQISAVTGKWEWTHYFTPNKRQEYVNQSTLVIARYMEVPITDKNGNVSNLYDALDINGQLLPEFQTAENVEKFTMGSPFMLDLVLQIKEMINRTHGDYTQIGKMEASTTILGRFITFMKKWMASAINTRFATEQENKTMGIKTKGRYRSYDKNSLALLGGGLGLVTLGLPGMAAVGLASYFLGETIGNKNVTNPVPFTQNLKYLLQRLLYSKMMWFNPKKYSDLLGEQYNEHFTPVDAANMRANMQELSQIITLFILYLLAKIALFDEDDEKDSPRRIAHNIVLNQLLKVNKDLYYFSSLKTPGQFVKNAFPIARVIDNSTSTLDSASKLIIGKKLRTNENTLGDNLQKFIPNAFRPVFGEIPLTPGDVEKPTTEPIMFKYLIEGDTGNYDFDF